MSKFVILHKKKDTLNRLCCIMKVTKQTLQHLRKKVPLANTLHHSTFLYNQFKKLTGVSLLAFEVYAFLYKICCQVILLTTVTPLDPNAHKVPPVLCFCLFSYAVFDSFYIEPIHLFGIGSVLLSLSADHL